MFNIVDIQVYVTLWFFSEAFPHPPQKILQELQGQVPWVQAWFDKVHARPACVAAREYRKQRKASLQYMEQLEAVHEGPPLSTPTFDVSGCNFIVTGGTQGLGLEIAHQLRKVGARKIALLSRTRSKGQAAVAEL